MILLQKTYNMQTVWNFFVVVADLTASDPIHLYDINGKNV